MQESEITCQQCHKLHMYTAIAKYLSRYVHECPVMRSHWAIEKPGFKEDEFRRTLAMHVHVLSW